MAPPFFRRAAIKRVNQQIPNGKKLVGTGSNRRLVRDISLLPVFRYIRILRELRGYSFAIISDNLEAALAKREGRKPVPRVHFINKRRWSEHKIRDCYNDIDNLLPRFKPSVRRKIYNLKER